MSAVNSAGFATPDEPLLFVPNCPRTGLQRVSYEKVYFFDMCVRVHASRLMCHLCILYSGTLSIQHTHVQRPFVQDYPGEQGLFSACSPH